MTRALWWLLVLSVVSGSIRAWACEFADNTSVYDVLGRTNAVADATSDLRLPRNPAFVFFERGSARPRLVAAGATIELELLGAEPAASHFGLQAARELLEPGVMYIYDGFVNFTVDDYVDESAPEPARILDATFTASEGGGACGFGSSCGDYGFVTAQIAPGTDDHTTRGGLTYAVHLGASADAASRTTQVERFLTEENGAISFVADYGWTETDMFLAVSVFDHAGNESARSTPFHIASARSGCQVAGSSSFGAFVWVMAALVWHATRRRARQLRE